MKIVISETMTHLVEHEVELPIYMQHDVSDDRPNDVFYRRIDQFAGHLRLLEVHVHDHDWGDQQPKVELEVIEPYRMDPRSSLDYNLGRGIYASSQEAFFDALAQAKGLVDLMQEVVAAKPLRANHP